MQQIFIWFYCLPVPGALLMIALATALFLFLRERFQHHRFWKIMTCLLLPCWIGVVCFSTLFLRTEGGNLSAPILTPFFSYYTALNGGSPELFRSNFMNAVLFYPAGLLAGAVLPDCRRHGRWKVLITFAFALLSVAIEYTQYRYGLGLAETDDVIHNSLGFLLGLLACSIPTKRFRFPFFRK